MKENLKQEPLLAEEILDLSDVRFIEPEFSDLTDDTFTLILEEIPADQGRLLVDEESDPLALAFHSGTEWLAGSFHLRRPTVRVIERFEDAGGDIFQEDRSLWEDAVREYYSISLAGSVTPTMEDMNPTRAEMVESLLAEVWDSNGSGSCLDCCCGSGVGSMVLRGMGIRPLSYDNDHTLLSLGLNEGRLLPRETMCIDARIAGRYCRGADAGLGLMFGEFNSFNQDMWEMITRELLAVTRCSIITVGTEREGDLIRSWVEDAGGSAEVRENPRDPIYDRWVCIIDMGSK